MAPVPADPFTPVRPVPPLGHRCQACACESITLLFSFNWSVAGLQHCISHTGFLWEETLIAKIKGGRVYCQNPHF